MPDELVELVATRFRAMSEPSRIRILDRLRTGEASVGELAGELGTTQQNVSRHLAVLHREGIVARRRDGNFIRYSLADPTVIALCEVVCGALATRLERLRAAVA